MKFSEYVEKIKKLMPAISFLRQHPAYPDVIRAWNSLAILFPEKVDDVVMWDHVDGEPYLAENPFRSEGSNKKTGKLKSGKINAETSTSESNESLQSES